MTPDDAGQHAAQGAGHHAARGAGHDAGQGVVQGVGHGAGRTGRERGIPVGAAAGIRLRDVPGVLELCEAWRRQSMICGWAADGDWQVAAVDAVALAAWRGTGLPAACAGLGRERARGGVGIGETLTDLAALCYVLDGGDPPLHLVQPLAEGWAEAGLATLSHGSCEDPLTGLTTLPYLRTRLAEQYREARRTGGSAADSHRLLVAELPYGLDPWHRLSALILVSNELRAAFPGGDTLSLATPGRAVALVRAMPELQFRATRLRRSLADAHGARLRLVKPPAQHQEALRLLDGLAR